MSERKSECICDLKDECPIHGEFAKREANATSMDSFQPDIAVARLDSGHYVIVDEANVEEVLGRLSSINKGEIARYTLDKVEKVVRRIH